MLGLHYVIRDHAAMSPQHIQSAIQRGFEGSLIDVECDMSNGLPSIHIVGLGDKAVDEAKERIRSAITNSKLKVPTKRLTLNLAPADLPKKGSYLDLPLAVAILCASNQLPGEFFKDSLIAGELSLDGSIKPIRGVINLVQVAKRRNIKTIFLPISNCAQASLIQGIELIGLSSLSELYKIAHKQLQPQSYQPATATSGDNHTSQVDFSEIKLQDQAKRALTIAAAGGHNVLLTGPPGTGKSMLARALIGILPPMSEEEILETTKIHSLGGQTSEEIISTRPFRDPHHSSSHTSIVGGGSDPKPGEVSFAHNGVLFLDEMPEFNRQTLESLRQPLETRDVTISRVNETVTYPANFMLVATKNPCPCGYYGDESFSCSCPAHKILHYQSKISGPMLDRIDIIVNVERIDNAIILHNNKNSSSEKLKHNVMKAQKLQKTRYKNNNITNANLTIKDFQLYCKLSNKAKQTIDSASEALALSTRSYIKTLRVAQSIADLESAQEINSDHITEALSYRHRPN